MKPDEIKKAIHEHHIAMGKKGGSVCSERKSEANRRNAIKRWKDYREYLKGYQEVDL